MNRCDITPRLRLAIAVMAYGGQTTMYHAPMWFSLGAELQERLDWLREQVKGR